MSVERVLLWRRAPRALAIVGLFTPRHLVDSVAERRAGSRRQLLWAVVTPPRKGLRGELSQRILLRPSWPRAPRGR